jgi:hypothetical protein
LGRKGWRKEGRKDFGFEEERRVGRNEMQEKDRIRCRVGRKYCGNEEKG